MRRLSFQRPNAKVRNPNRHIRSLKKWADDFEGYYPDRRGDKYDNFKIWTLDRLIEGNASKHEWQRVAIQQLIIAANHLINAKPKNEQGKSWVAVLLSYPNLSASEVTVFFDKDYYQSFMPAENKISTKSILEKYDLDLGILKIEFGYIDSFESFDENDESYIYNQERWTLGESTL